MNEFVCREMTLDDRAKALEWLSAAASRVNKGNTPFPAECYPETGCAVYCENTLLCVLPFYIELTTDMLVLGFCTPSPDIAPKLKHAAVECAIRGTLQHARTLGKKYIFAMFGNRAINRIADRIGFVSADKNVEEKFCLIV